MADYLGKVFFHITITLSTLAMATLQRSFKYNGDLTSNPIDEIILKFKVPVYEYQFDSADDLVDPDNCRKVAGFDLAGQNQQLDVNAYAAAIDSGNFTGQSLEASVFFYYYLLAITRPKRHGQSNIDALSANINVQFWLPEGGMTGSMNLDVIYFVKKWHEISKIAGTGVNQQIKDQLDKNLFLINKAVFDELAVLFHQETGLSERELLLVIAKFAEVRGESILGNLTPVEPNDLVQVIPEPHAQKAADIVNAHYRRLFDFPITVPEIKEKELNIAGSFRFITGDGIIVEKRDFSFYTITAAYSSGVASDFQAVYYDWSKNSEEVTNNKLPFAFDNGARIKRYSFNGTVTVTAKDFNGAVVWTQDFDPADESLQNISIEVTLQRPFNLSTPAGTTPGDNGKKLRGQLLELSNKCPLDEVTIVIQAKKSGDTIWRVVGATTTDKAGYFSMPYPGGDFIAAQALVSINANSPVEIALTPERAGETISDFLYLMVEDSNCIEVVEVEEDDCDCHTVKKPKRLPDQADLIGSDEYTQDVGASCLNLTTPNRTLREYSHQAIVHLSDPDVANYVLEKITNADGTIRYNLTGGTNVISRGIVNLQNPIRWQDSPDSAANLSLYQAVSVATGHILHYKSVFKADGYSLGELLYSLPLAPGQKKQVVVFDSSHSLTGAESQTISQGESLSASLVNDRSITDQLSGSIGELMSGSSDASTSGISAGLGGAGSMGAFGASLGVSGGYANSNSSASQNSSRDISQFFGERLRQSIMQNASSYRQLNATVVTTVRQSQQYALTTEAVANHNHCHSVTMMYFEVLRHYAIFQELSHVEECVFVPLLMTNFTAENISKWKDVLASRLLPLPSSTYLQPVNVLLKGRQHPLIKAFDANERIKTNYADVEYPVGRFADERMNELTGQLRIRIHIPRPKTRFDRILSLPVIKKTITSRGDVDVAGTISDNIKDSVIGAVVPCAAKGPSIKYETNSTEVLSRKAIFDMFMTLDANYENVPPAQCIRVNFDGVDVFETPMGLYFQGDLTPTPMDFFAGMEKEKALWNAYAAILGMSTRELFKYFNNNVVADWDRIFNEHIAPMIAEKLVRESTINIVPLGSFDITAMEKYNGGDRIMGYNLQGTTSLTRSSVDKIKINFTSPITGIQKDVFFNFVTFKLESITVNYTTDFSSGTLTRRSSSNDLRDGVPEMFTPLNNEEKRNPRNEDKVMVRQLLEHLNSNLEYYNKLLWFNLDPDRRFMLLDGFSIQVFDDLGTPNGYRSLASVVKNQLITVTGNSLVFPVSSGFKVSPAYISAVNSEDGAHVQVSLLDHYKPRTPIPPYRISVPTRGVYLEAIQGTCDSCEKVKPNSSQDWSKFPVEEPTAIAPVTTPVPQVTDWKAAFKDFAAPLINIQNAPDTPAPGAGLAGLSELLGKAGVFNDITGLQGNQQNAIRTYLSNQENVRAMAEMAKGLAMQQHNTQNSQSITDSITQARQSGAISQEEESGLVRQHLQQQIDGGERMREEARTQREQARPSLTEAAIEAASQGRTVTAQQTDADGNTESVEIRGAEVGEGTYINIGYDVPRLQQPSSSSCWATAATMMVNWKTRLSSSIPDVLREAGRNLVPPDEIRYTNMFTNNQSLLAGQKAAFITALDMISEGPANYTVGQYLQWMRTYGPLWITIDSSTATGVFSPHAKILTRITGTTEDDTANLVFHFNDPASERLQDIQMYFDDFLRSFEQMVTDNPRELFIQVVHFRDPINPGEGPAPAPPTPRTWMNGVPGNMTEFKQLMQVHTTNEYNYWHDGGSHPGGAWWETDADAHVVDTLTSYWRTSFNTDTQGIATTQISEAGAATNIANRSPWSAAFISFIITRSGIVSNDVFTHSIRHVDFIARAIRNKEERMYGNPFWGYRINDYSPQVGDLVGRSGHVTYDTVVNRSNWVVNHAESHMDVVVEVNDDHILVIGGNLELDSIQTDRTEDTWTNRIPPDQQVNVSVGKRRIYLDEYHKIDPAKTWEIYNNATGSYESRVQYTGPQSEYFVVIKVRTDVNT